MPRRSRVTGNKLDDKIYHHHTGYIGGIKSIALGKLLKEHPERAIEFAVKGMLPKTTLGRRMFRKLHVFAGDKHPHQRAAAETARRSEESRPYGSQSELRHRPAQDRHRARLYASPAPAASPSTSARSMSSSVARPAA